MKARFAPVAPLAIQQGLELRGVMGDYHLLIASEVVKNPQEYTEFYRAWRVTPDHCVVMDNGMIETGYAGDAELLLGATRIVGAEYILLPDVPDNAEATLQIAIPVGEEMIAKGYRPTPILQGTTRKELVECIKQFAKNLEGFKGFAIPRSINDYECRRSDIAKYLLRRFRTHSVHLLGFSSDLEDDIKSISFRECNGT